MRVASWRDWRDCGGCLGSEVLGSSDVIPIPDWMSYEEAATLPTAGLTAWNAVLGHHELHAGDVVLVQGTGGVSTFALQFAVAAGAHRASLPAQ